MSLLSKSLSFTVGTLLSRFTGLLRDIVVASTFGATTLLDAFLLANRIPNLLRDMLAEGALGSSFTKVYSSLCVEDRNEALKLFSSVLRLAFLVVAILCLLGIIFSPFLVKCFTLISFSGRDPSFYINSISLTRILFPSLLFAVLGAIVMGVVNERGKFFLSAISSVFLNIGYIIGALVFSKILVNVYDKYFSSVDWLFSSDPSITGLSIGVLVGAIFQFLILASGVKQEFKKILSCKDFFHLPSINPNVKKVFYLMIPAAIGSSAGTINIFINTNFATSLETGSITWLNFAFRLIQLPVGLFGVAIGVVTLPSLSKKVSLAIKNKLSLPVLDFEEACILTLWLIIPCFSFILSNSNSIIDFVYGYGKFSSSSVYITSQVLFAYSFCLIPYALIKVITSFYYALDKVSYTMKVSLVGIGINLIACFFLTNYFGVIGLSVTSSVTLGFNLLLLFIGLYKQGINIFTSKFFKSLFYLSIAFILTLVVQHFINNSSILQTLSDNLASYFSFLKVFSSKIYPLISMCLNFIVLFFIFLIFSFKAYGTNPKDLYQKLLNIKRK